MRPDADDVSYVKDSTPPATPGAPMITPELGP